MRVILRAFDVICGVNVALHARMHNARHPLLRSFSRKVCRPSPRARRLHIGHNGGALGQLRRRLPTAPRLTGRSRFLAVLEQPLLDLPLPLARPRTGRTHLLTHTHTHRLAEPCNSGAEHGSSCRRGDRTGSPPDGCVWARVCSFCTSTIARRRSSSHACSRAANATPC
jgi:hypothetical protein